MGVLTVGKPVKWEDSLDLLEYVRHHGVEQFINLYQKYKGIQKDLLFYGDEIEYGLFRLDSEARKVYLSLRGAEVREILEKREGEERQGVAEAGKCTWHPEYGSWMVESTPAEPYSGFTADLRRVETNMRARRARLLAALHGDEIAPTIVVFPMLGVGDTAGDFAKRGPYANSDLIPDEVINPHPRFGTLTRNIRSRRGSNVKIEVPRFRDLETPPEETKIEMDAMAFGMGCCCLQVTFQCRDVQESRHVYDQLVVIAPIMLALTAATPILNGKLSDHDVRWEVIEMSVDDRTPAERGEPCEKGDGDARMVGGGRRPIRTSRYSGVSSYLCNHKHRCDLHCAARHYNDVDVEVDQHAKARLVAAGCDELVARHVSHLFVRDPLVTFEGMVKELDDSVHTDHFENIQSTNWNSVRWKPPPEPNPANIGWRVELRTMEVQLTDFENAAFTVFVTLVLRVLLSFDLNVYMPMSKVQDNMRRAHERDAITRPGGFWWRSHLAYPESTTDCPSGGQGCSVHSSYERVEEMSVLEILAGKRGYYPGLVPLVLAYLDQIGCDPETERIVRSYLDLIVKRASGELLTASKWMRDFVQDHPDYKRDSVVPHSTAHDLLRACHDVGVGRMYVPELLGVEPIAPVVKENAYNVQLSHIHLESKDNTLAAILERYAERARLVQRRTEVFKLLAEKTAEIKDLQFELAAINAALEPSQQQNHGNGSLSASPSRTSVSTLDHPNKMSASDLLGLEKTSISYTSRSNGSSSN